MRLICTAAVELKISRYSRDVGARLFHRLAGVARLDQSKLVCVIRDRARKPHQHASAIGCGHPPPRARIQSLTPRRNRPLHVACIGFANAREGEAIGRRDHIEFVPGIARRPRIAYEDALCCSDCVERTHLGEPFFTALTAIMLFSAPTETQGLQD